MTLRALLAYLGIYTLQQQQFTKIGNEFEKEPEWYWGGGKKEKDEMM